MFLSKFSVYLPKIPSFATRLLSDTSDNLVTTLIGAATPIGRTTSLLLKQNPHIDELRLYDEKEDACGVALDLSHIDTNTKVLAFAGRKVLPEALMDAHIIVVCDGKQKTQPDEPISQLFEENAPIIQDMAIYAAEFNPEAVFCIAAPPLDALVPIASEEYRKANVYDPRKIIGITTLAGVRANSIVGRKLSVNPASVVCPIVGGSSSETLIPVFSQITPCTVPYCDTKELQENIGRAEDDVLKQCEAKTGLVLSPAFAISQFVTPLAKAIKGDKNSVVCCYVRQTGHIGDFLKYMTSIVKLGRHGVDSTHMPQISQEECVKLQAAAQHIRKCIEVGEAFVSGDVNIGKMAKQMDKPCQLIKTEEAEAKKEQPANTKAESKQETPETRVANKI